MNTTNLKEAMDSAFKFKIGDHVCSVQILEAAKEELEINGPIENGYLSTRVGGRPPEIIIERLIQECHGGVQKFYVLRRWTKDNQEMTVKLTEFEVAPYSDIRDLTRQMVVERKERAK